ncbi:MFS family permease [Rhizobium leguminosarum]|uniref:MFS family permease n=1 Tax=Rhizobium leguminosarum TaxID=384 RepID=A0AAE2MLE2_RHILE|nr:MFS family permease [Rhizobium leguminosarum]MBB4430521.1 MFS family permease [Rhizobium esperanzae]MBB4297536.1 MFS family permease [Rhizobium leguminosarum]MBB4308676.1 MFS family permease [Rhizobium leguminosarum]MBB4416511.1 MFS family permease [Rhizobium leguminosarum]
MRFIKILTIEFFDFYVYATAAVLVFPHLFFPASDSNAATLQSLVTFSIAFFARPIGAVVFGHFGDRIGRKATLAAALMTMGLSTVLIGMLPGYDAIGIAAPLLLALCRFGQGLGLGGEGGGAVLLATENAPPGKRSWYAMFPQLGAPIGFILSSGFFLILAETMSNEDFLDYGWRIPFIASLALVAVGLYVRLKIAETPEFRKAVEKHERVAVPIEVVFRGHLRSLILGTFIAVATFVLFYLMTVFTLSWGTTPLEKGGLGYRISAWPASSVGFTLVDSHYFCRLLRAGERLPQHSLRLFPEPQGHGSLLLRCRRPIRGRITAVGKNAATRVNNLAEMPGTTRRRPELKPLQARSATYSASSLGNILKRAARLAPAFSRNSVDTGPGATHVTVTPKRRTS